MPALMEHPEMEDKQGGHRGPPLRPALKRCTVSLRDGFSSRRIDRKALRGTPPAM
ncbi:MAG: hypothetical protein V8K32_07980 [Candidatus Electrothrix gigas]